jgi:hypothetical protein
MRRKNVDLGSQGLLGAAISIGGNIPIVLIQGAGKVVSTTIVGHEI